MTTTPEAVDLLVVGAGPTGLVAAIEALRHGLSVRLVDQAERRSPHSKALVLHARSLEVLDDLGCVDAVLQAGRPFVALNVLAPGGRALGRIEFSRLDWGGAPYPMWLTIPQSETERCLEERLVALGGKVERPLALRTVKNAPHGVEAELVRPDGTTETCRAAWLVGADGASSSVRRALGTPLEGDTTGELFMLADVAIESPLTDGEGYNVLARDGVLLIVPMPKPGVVRLIAHLPKEKADAPPTIDLPMLQRLVDTRTGLPTRLSSLGWTSVFSPKHFMASALRRGRVFLAGDAAHIHSPVGGQGLNTGLQDTYNLVWKLAAVHRGRARAALLDTYQVERHAVGERMIHGVRRATRALTLRAPLAQAVRNRVAGVALGLPRVRDQLGAPVGMLTLRYDPGLAVAAQVAPGSPRTGERAAQQASTPALSASLRGTQHTLLLFDGLRARVAEADVEAVTALARRHAGAAVKVLRVRHGDAAGPDELADADGAVHRAFSAELPLVVWVRPDKHVAFRGPPSAEGVLRAWLTDVFVAPVALSGPRPGAPAP